MNGPKHPEIDHHRLKIIVGLIALSLAFVTGNATDRTIASISASYHEGGFSRDFFVGCLTAVAAFLFVYNGHSRGEMILSKLAGFAAIGVAFFPCACDGGDPYELSNIVHYASAAVMFLALAIFCRVFRKKALAKGTPDGRRRAPVYAACGLTIILSIAVLALDATLLDGSLDEKLNGRLTFWVEGVALVAFGVAWMIASLVVPRLKPQS